MFPTAFEMVAAGLTDTGRIRSRNEDSYHLDPDIGLALVCDGMGGHAGGDIASRTAVEAIVDFIEEFHPGAPPAPDAPQPFDADRTLSEPLAVQPAVQNAASVVRSAVQLANRRIHALNQERGFPDGRGMGTTVVGLFRVAGTDRLIVFHAGDSRLYRLRDGELKLMTRDHSLYQAWLDKGQRGTAPPRNIIVRALGNGEHVDPEIAVLSVLPQDAYLLCSDGLNGMVPDAMIARILEHTARLRPQDACAILVEAANKAGGNDNITVVLSRFVPRG